MEDDDKPDQDVKDEPTAEPTKEKPKEEPKEEAPGWAKAIESKIDKLTEIVTTEAPIPTPEQGDDFPNGGDLIGNDQGPKRTPWHKRHVF